MQLSDLCLCKPIDCSKLSTLNENDHDHWLGGIRFLKDQKIFLFKSSA
jgi:hypothetical protein